MKRTIHHILLIPLLMLLSSITFAMPAYAATPCGGSNPAKQQVFSGVGQTTSSSCDDSGVSKAIAAAIEILSFVVGAAAVVAIISGSFKYITSGGDSGKVSNAKNTLIYALIGLAIAVLAQVLVHFVINTANDTANACPFTIKDAHGHVVQGLHVGDPQCKKP